LCSLLSSTGVAGRPESYFRQPDEPLWAERWQIDRRPDGSCQYADYVRSAIAAGSTSNGVFGARVMWGTLAEMLAKLGRLHPHLAGSDLGLLEEVFGPLRFVHLRREDTVAQAVSWARAEQTNYWHAGDTASRPPHYDPTQIRQLAATVEEHNVAWRTWFAGVGIRPHEVGHEEMIADPAGAVRDVLDFLTLEPAASGGVTSGEHRQADQLNTEWITRYRAAVARGLKAVEETPGT